MDPRLLLDEVAPLLDVSDANLAELLASDNPALARSVARLIADLDDPNGVISAFNSFVD